MRLTSTLTALATLLALAACGVDGEPERPTRAEMPEPGISISGSVEFGIVGGN